MKNTDETVNVDRDEVKDIYDALNDVLAKFSDRPSFHLLTAATYLMVALVVNCSAEGHEQTALEVIKKNMDEILRELMGGATH